VLFASQIDRPIELQALPHYANRKFAAATRRGAFAMPAQSGKDAHAYVPLLF
jgi:hypothetical protein